MKLVAEGLTSIRGGRTIFADLSFAAQAGEALILTGPNGAGKTTLIRTIAGFLKPVAGRLRLDAREDERSLGEQCHYVGHLNAVKASLSVEENAAFWCGYLGGAPAAADARVEAALAAFGLGELRDIPAAYLSAGQKRRLGLARLLVAERLLWLLDEPTVSLDTASQAMLAAAMEAHLTAGGLVVAATHVPLGLSRSRELRLGLAAMPARSDPPAPSA